MRSTFFGFDIARKALFTSQRSLDVVAHNIANANTPGYTRQEALQRATQPFNFNSLHRPMTVGQIGTGVEISEIRRIRDSFLDKQYRQEMSAFGEWEAKFAFIEKLEGVFNEPSDSGIRTVLDQFWGSMQDLSNNPENTTIRELVLQRAIAVTETIRHSYRQLDTLQVEINNRIMIKVDEVNSLAKQIADLNGLIFRSEVGGDVANDLRDRRDLLIDQLSKIVNIQVHENPQRELTVLVNGIGIVSHVKHISIDASQRNDENNLSTLKWADTNMNVTLRSGELFGLLEMRDKTVPDYIERLNNLAGVMVSNFNNLHRQGYGLGETVPGERDFFVFRNERVDPSQVFYQEIPFNPAPGSDWNTWRNYTNPSNLSKEFRYIPARDIYINSELMNNVDLIAAAFNPGEPGDGTLALALAQLKHIKDHNHLRIYINGEPNSSIVYRVNEGTLDDYTRAMVAGLGVKGQQALRMSENQYLLTLQTDNRRQEISGVSLDEEMTNMIRFQHSYNAAARVVTAMDEMLDLLITRLGIVGR